MAIMSGWATARINGKIVAVRWDSTVRAYRLPATGEIVPASLIE